MPDRSTLEQADARARAEVLELESTFGAAYGPLPEIPPKPEVPKHQPINRHVPGRVAFAMLGGGDYKYR